MRRILGLTSILFLLTVAPAYAGRGGGHGGGHGGRWHGGGGGGRVVVRDHRSGGGRVVVRDHRRGPVHVVNGRYMFPGGVVRVYSRPVIRTHYYNIHVRPVVIVEAYDPVPGYIWVAGNWRWGGSEWIWAPGYWSVDAHFVVQ